LVESPPTPSSSLEYDDLRDVVLIGHSYGGIVATGTRTARVSACGA
jgi:hypothetical protein